MVKITEAKIHYFYIKFVIQEQVFWFQVPNTQRDK